MRKFMRTRAESQPHQPPHQPLNGHAHKNNGHANGAGARRDEQHSTLSRYWSGSEVSTGAGGGASMVGGALFEDSQFPATWRALGDKRLAAGVRWMRPHELCSRPRFRGDDRVLRESASLTSAALDAADIDEDEDPARWHVEASALSGAAVCAAAAALALAPRLLDRALPPHSFAHRYTGAFRFRFWVFGSWREVTVDDRLPVRGGRVLCASSSVHDDFTLALLHKAYAKLHGGFAALRGAGVARALQDLSGAIVQSFSLRHQPHALTFQVLNSAVPRSTLLVATLVAENNKRTYNGLLSGQAYCVTGLARVREASGTAGSGVAGALVRLRAVCGRGTWAGAWAPHTQQWRALPPPDRELLADRAMEPGDFWMSFGDFALSFSSLELVHVGPDDWLHEPALHARRPWRAVLARRRWRYGYNAGGPPSCTETTGTNPQFHVQIPRAETNAARKCHVVVSVTQQYEIAGGPRLCAIGFCVYELPPGAAPRRDLHPLQGLRSLDVTHESRAREVVTFFTLPPGRYLVVPHTRHAHTEGAFLLRILTDDHTDVWELNEDNSIVRDLSAEFVEDERTIPVRGGAGGGGAAGGRGRRGAGRGVAARAAAARVARGAVRGAVAGAVPRAGGAARRRAGRRHARARPARAAGAAGLLARRLPAPGRATLRSGPARVVVPPARAAVGERRHGLQQGAGVPRAALRPPRRAGRGGVRDGAGATAPRARALSQPRHQSEIEPAISGGDDPDDDLLVRVASESARVEASHRHCTCHEHKSSHSLYLLQICITVVICVGGYIRIIPMHIPTP